jgi:hypoxanthine phosphoribosyltransferase
MPREPEPGEILISAESIAGRVAALGRDLSHHYVAHKPVLVGVMNGCIPFVTDLVRALPGPIDVEFVTAQSYNGTTAGAVRLTLPDTLARRVAGRSVVIVDDIFDTGRTLTAVCRAVEALSPADVRTLVLLRKHLDGTPSPGREPDWVGFDIPDLFVIGYGLDYHDRYRDLPHIAVLTGYEGSAAPGRPRP